MLNKRAVPIVFVSTHKLLLIARRTLLNYSYPTAFASFTTPGGMLSARIR